MEFCYTARLRCVPCNHVMWDRMLTDLVVFVQHGNLARYQGVS